MSDTCERLRPWTWPIVALSGLLVALRFGFNFGIGNHNTYLLHALRRADPSVLAGDWLATQTQDYHPVFTRLAAWLIELDGTGWLIALCNFAAIVAGTVAVFLIIRELAGEKQALPSFMLVSAFVGIGSTYSVSGSYLYSMTFQPSTLAAVGYLFALLFFVRERYLVSGIVLASCSVFHANYLVLAFPLFGLAHLFLGLRRLLPRLLMQLGPSLVPLALLAPLLLGQTGSPNIETARHIYQQVVSPQHYVPLTFVSEFYVYAAWCGLGLLAGWRIMRASESARRLRGLWLATIALVGVATLLTTAIFLPLVSQLYFWRLAPFTVLCAQIFAAIGLVKFLTAEDVASSRPTRVAPFLFAAVMIWITFRFHYGEFRGTQYGLLIALAVVYAVWPWLRRLSPRFPHYATPVVVAGIWLTAALIPAVGVFSRSNLISGLPSDEQELYAWVATTPERAVFLIPPRLDNFRLNARRAVIVDTKSQPIDPDQLIEWYQRVQIVSGRAGVSGRNEAEAGYGLLDSARVVAIGGAYPFDYVVVRGAHSFVGMNGLEPAFANESYRVYSRTAPSSYVP